jgi:uncharacterized repeat protein (TIGR01451 family)
VQKIALLLHYDAHHERGNARVKYRQIKLFFHQHRFTRAYNCFHSFSRFLIFSFLFIISYSTKASADVPISLYRSFAGNINVTATGATLRTQPNGAGTACVVTNGPVTMPLSGIPAGSTISAAYLYWAGSGATIDSNVTFNGTAVTADRTFTASTVVAGTTYYFFSGFKDVTSMVAGNGNYTFADLTVATGAPYCGVQAVLSGAALIVIYSNPAEDFRVINSWDGFQIFYNSSITLTPTNFMIPTSPINGKHLVVTWEGDPDISGGENINFNGTNLSDALNTAGSLWNSTINTIPTSASYGVDIDVFDVSSYLTAGATSATAIYSTGGDLVILTTQVMSVTNTPVADLAIAKTHSGDFYVGANGIYTLSVRNNGPNNATGTITVTDTLPTGLTYVSASGAGWTCGAVGQTVTCARPGPLVNGASAPDIALTVAVGAAASPSVSNSATVTSGAFDNIAANNTASDLTTVITPGLGNKPLYLYSGPSYTISRAAPSGTPATVTIGAGASQIWSQLPVAQGNITINPSVSATAPVYLQAARSGGAGNISLTVRLQCSSGGTILTQTANCAAGAEPTTQQCIYNLPLGAALSCAAGNSWRLTVVNNNATRTLYIHPVSGGNSSRVILPSTTVIDVTSVAAYSAAYPSTSTVSYYAPGSTVYLRVVASDPFGSFDITSAAITIRDSGSAVIVNGAAMTQVNDSGALTKIYEYAYTVPPAGPAGSWSATAVAREGNEGAVSDSGSAAFTVALPPNITVVKSVLIESDPINGAVNPKAIPGAVMVYSITVMNSGAGAADSGSIVITDPIPANTTMSVDTGSGDPVIFSCSAAPVCGLTWNYTTAVSYSSQVGGGVPFNYSPGTSGFDPLVTGIRIDPAGVLNGSGAYFSTQFRVRVN